MRSYIRKIRNSFLSRLVLFSLFSSSAVWADIVTFQYKGVITEVDSELRRVGDSASSGIEVGYEVGDTFSGEYTFSSDSFVTGGSRSGSYASYRNAVTGMSFVSGRNSSSYAEGEIHFGSVLGLCAAECNRYRVFFLNVVTTSSTNFFNGVFHPTFIELAWFLSGNLPDFNNGPLIDPLFDTNQVQFAANGGHHPPVYGKIDFGYTEEGGIRIKHVKGVLHSVTAINNRFSLTVDDNTWVQIGLNAAPPEGSATVADIIGDDISEPYDTDWVLYSYETDTNTYKKLSLTDTMRPGVGYWFFQATDHSVTLDMPDTSTDVNATQHIACPSIVGGCFEIPLHTNSTAAQWQMISYPFRDKRNIDRLRIVTNAGDCRIGCTLSQAKAEGIVSDTLWNYDGSVYQELTDSGSEPFEPWDGAWLATLPAASGMAPKLLIPAAN